MARLSSRIYVPAADSAENIRSRDVLGSKSDTHAGSSIVGLGRRLDEHIHSVSRVYPTLADGVTLDTAVAVWTAGALTEIIPASTITSDFDIHSVDIAAISANGEYELTLYYGAGDTEAGSIRFVQTAVMSAVLNTPIQTPLIPANSRIRATLASAAGTQSAIVSLRYHTY